jgi:membrane protein required for colicin V production
MSWLDVAFIAVILVSALISLVRGFVREVISIAVWVGAFWIGIRFAAELAFHLEPFIASPTLRLGSAFAALFIATLLLGALVNFLATTLIGKTGLTGTDRALGMVFGALRGVVIVAILVMLAGLTAVPRETWWQRSVLAGQLQPWVCLIGIGHWMDGLTVYQPLVTDTEEASGQPAASYWEEFCANPDQ